MAERRDRIPCVSRSKPSEMVKDPAKTRFVYREALWRGADMFGAGVASFGHVNGVHLQNLDTWEAYTAATTGLEGREYEEREASAWDALQRRLSEIAR